MRSVYFSQSFTSAYSICTSSDVIRRPFYISLLHIYACLLGIIIIVNKCSQPCCGHLGNRISYSLTLSVNLPNKAMFTVYNIGGKQRAFIMEHHTVIMARCSWFSARHCSSLRMSHPGLHSELTTPKTRLATFILTIIKIITFNFHCYMLHPNPNSKFQSSNEIKISRYSSA